MTVQPATPHPHSDILSRLDFRRRLHELHELAAQESIVLPLKAEWIVALELVGIAVDLRTGEWLDADSVAYAPTGKAKDATQEDKPHE